MKIINCLLITLILSLTLLAQVKPPSESAMDRFLRYVKIDTQSAEDQSSVPSTKKQFDLARLLGSMVGDDGAMWGVGLEAYGGLSEEERALARVLDRSGVVVAAANWLRWLYREGRRYDDRAAVAARVAGLVGRLTGGVSG